jgi:hypothetical protein
MEVMREASIAPMNQVDDGEATYTRELHVYVLKRKSVRLNREIDKIF